MKKYAVIKDNQVINVIIAESESDVVIEESEYLLLIGEEDIPWIGWSLEEDGWRPPQPDPSFVWNGSEWIEQVIEPTIDEVIEETSNSNTDTESAQT